MRTETLIWEFLFPGGRTHFSVCWLEAGGAGGGGEIEGFVFIGNSVGWESWG